MLCRDSEEPACRGGVLPDASIGQGPGTPRQRGQKTVTVQGGGACPAVAQRKRGRAFCRPAVNFIAFWRVRGTTFINDREIVQVDETWKGQRRSDRGTKLSRSQKIVQMQKVLLRVEERVRVPG